MSPLKEPETHDYLFHRLKIAGLTGKNPFKSADIKSIHKVAGGLPGNINEKAHALLLNRLSREKSTSHSIQLSGFFKKSFLIIAGFLAVLSLVIFLFFFKEKKSNISSVNLPGPKIQVSSNLEKTAKKLPDFSASASSVVSSNSSEKATQLLDKPKDNFNKTVSSASVNSKDEPGKKKKQEKTVPKKLTKGKQIYRENWLLAQNPSYYTIQLIGLQNEKSIYKFVKKYKLFYHVAYYKTLYHKKDWYPLLYGAYPSRREALSAMKKLPQELGKLSPWIRSFSSIQQIIKSL